MSAVIEIWYTAVARMPLTWATARWNGADIKPLRPGNLDGSYKIRGWVNKCDCDIGFTGYFGSKTKNSCCMRGCVKKLTEAHGIESTAATAVSISFFLHSF